MKFAYDLTGAAPHIKRFQINATLSSPGIPVLKGGSNSKGIVACSTTAAVGLIGITMDTNTLVTAQQTDKSDTARTVTVIINPLAVYKTKLSGGATENTALTKIPVTTASTDGLTVTTNTDWTSPETDEGMLFGYDGANAGVLRKITSTSSTAATLLVALPVNTVIGDNFFRVPFTCSPAGYETQFVQLTTNLYQVDQSAAVNTTNVNFRVVETDLKAADSVGVSNSFAFLIANGSVWSAGLVV